MIPSTAWSIGASSKMMLAAFPPSSSVYFFFVGASAFWMILPTSVRAGEGDLVDVGMIDDRSAGFSRAGDDVHHARRKVAILNDLGQLQCRQRRRLGGLEYDRASARQRRRDFPRGHEQREIPRNHLPRDAQRRRAFAGQRVFEFVRPSRVIKEMRRRQRHIDIARFANRLAAIHRFDHRELARAILDHPRDAIDIFAALLRGHLRPDFVVCLAGRVHRSVNIFLRRQSDLGQLLLVRRVDRLEIFALGRRRELAVDEQVILRLELHMPRTLGRGA